MDEITTLPIHDRDIRQSSIPRLRQSSHRAKYGGTPPNDAFALILECHDAFPRSVELGKPTTNLTPRERFRVAQGSVGRLIGKRVNKHNQRTGERDPWYYWGPGRKWAMQQASGRDMNVREGLIDLEDEEFWDGLARRDILQERWEYFWLKDDNKRSLNALEEGRLPPENPMGTVVALREREGGAMYRIRTVKRKRRSELREIANDEWEFVRDTQDLRGTDADDDWEILSVHSAPG